MYLKLYNQIKSVSVSPDIAYSVRNEDEEEKQKKKNEQQENEALEVIKK